MPVRIFVPKIPSNYDEFREFIKSICSPLDFKFCKNKDGNPYCFLTVCPDDQIKCPSDLINMISGKVVGGIILRPRIITDQKTTGNNTDVTFPPSDAVEDTVNTTHFDKGFYFVQLLSEKQNNNLVSSHLNSMFLDYESKKIPSLQFNEIKVNGLYASFYLDEDQLYRVKIIDKSDSYRVKVLFIDYGNEEWVITDEVFPITDILKEIPPLAHKCIIDGVVIVDSVRHELAANSVLHKNMKAAVVKQYDESLNADRVIAIDYVDYTTSTYRKNLVVEGIAEPIKTEKLITSIPPPIKEITEAIESNHYNTAIANGNASQQCSAVMCHMDSLSKFFLQPDICTNKNNLEKIVQLIDLALVDDRSDLEYSGVDKYYLSQFTEDGNWYRCSVIKDRFSTHGYCVVRYIDFGNSEQKTELSSLRPLTSEWNEHAVALAKIPPCATRCRFDADLLKAFKEWNISPVLFNEIIAQSKELTVQYSEDDSETKSVNFKLPPMNGWIIEKLSIEGVDALHLFQSVVENGVSESHADITINELVTNDIDTTVEEFQQHRLTNIESLDCLWFRLEETPDEARRKELRLLSQWVETGRCDGQQAVMAFAKTDILGAVVEGGRLTRCRVVCRNTMKVVIQDIDTGVYHIVPVKAIFYLPEDVRTIHPLAVSVRLSVANICVAERDVELKIEQLLSQKVVRLLSSGPNEIQDVISADGGMKLVDCLRALRYIRNTSIDDDCLKDLPDWLLPNGEESANIVEFSIPTLEEMDMLPSEICYLNAKVKFARKILTTSGHQCVFDELWTIADKCASVGELCSICRRVDGLSDQLKLLKERFVDFVRCPKAKLKDLDPLIEQRTSICRQISALYSTIDGLLAGFPQSDIESLRDAIHRMAVCVAGLLTVFDSFDGCFSMEVDIETVRQQVAKYRDSNEFAEVLDLLQRFRDTSDRMIDSYRAVIDHMCKDYDIGEQFPDKADSAPPLIDATFRLQSALKDEIVKVLELLGQPQQQEKEYNMVNVLRNVYCYLQKQSSVMDRLLVDLHSVDDLNKFCEQVLHSANEIDLLRRIDENNKAIITHRSVLRHAVPDLEDAEELDQKDKVDELTTVINAARFEIHKRLAASNHLIDDDARQSMLRRPEIQLKNQSIFYADVIGSPVFIWDAIYFDFSKFEMASVPFQSSFGGNDVNILKIQASAEDFRSMLSNVSVYSQLFGNNGNNRLLRPLCILYAFISRTENNSVYLVLPRYEPMQHWSVNNTVATISDVVQFMECAMELVLTMWHDGFVYSAADLEAGPVVRFSQQSNEQQSSKSIMSLPLPLTSIIYRDRFKHEAIDVCLSKLGRLFEEALNMLGINEKLIELAQSILKCRDLDNAEYLVEQLKILGEELLADVVASSVVQETGDSSGTGNESSIEQIKEDDLLGENEDLAISAVNEGDYAKNGNRQNEHKEETSANIYSSTSNSSDEDKDFAELE